MNRKSKVILILIGIIVFAYLAFVTIDIVRLRNSKLLTKPLILLKENVVDGNILYTGLGYNIKYYVDRTNEIANDTEYIGIYGYGAECRFLGILVWAWIE